MNDIIAHYQDQFAALSPDLTSGEPNWLIRQRGDAMEHLRRFGFPRPRDEDWRYFPLRNLTGKAFDAGIDTGGSAGELPLDAWSMPALDSHRFVFVDGVYQEKLSSGTALPSGMTVRPISQVLRQSPNDLLAVFETDSYTDNGFLALNNAFFRDGYVVEVGAGEESDRVLEFLFVSAGSGKAGQMRNILRLCPNAKMKVIERHVSKEGLNAMVNASTRLILEPGSSLDYHLVETMERGISMVNDVSATLARDSSMKIVTTTLGGDVVRNNLKISLDGPGAHCDLLGLYVTGGRQHVDNHTGVVHTAPHCSSREHYKGVLNKRSRGVFHGRIRVEQGAVKTDATQANHNLLLSPDAEIDTKPQLEIYADDVKCAHGATVGQLDSQALFYLRSRGIDKVSARSLLTFAFVNEVLGEVDVEPLRDFLSSALSERLIEHE